MIGEHIDISTLPSEYGGDGVMPSFDVRTYLASDPYLRVNNYNEINSTFNNDYMKNCDDNDNTNNRNNATDNNDYDNNHNHNHNDGNNDTNDNNNNHNNYDDNPNSSQENMSCRKQSPPIYS
jgi:hypothetical protein